MTQVFDCADEQQREAGISAARDALADGELVVLPTDTVYGLAADAFNVGGVERVFEAKGRGREMPPPVLVPNPRTVDGLAMAMPSYVRRLIKEFWPGALTIVLRAQQSLSWDLGDTNGTVGLRMPDDELALELLAETGPLAVSSANRTGKPAATTVTEAGFMLGHYVDLFLDGGERPGGAASTIIDCTKPDPVVLREGAIAVDRLREVLGDIDLVVAAAHEDEPEDLTSEDDPPDDAEVACSADMEIGEEPSLGDHWDDHDSGREYDEQDVAPDADDPSPREDPSAGQHHDEQPAHDSDDHPTPTER